MNIHNYIVCALICATTVSSVGKIYAASETWPRLKLKGDLRIRHQSEETETSVQRNRKEPYIKDLSI